MFEANTALLASNIYVSGFQLCSWQSTSHNQAEFREAAVLDWPVFNFISICKYKYVKVYTYVFLSLGACI